MISYCIVTQGDYTATGVYGPFESYRNAVKYGTDHIYDLYGLYHIVEYHKVDYAKCYPNENS